MGTNTVEPTTEIKAAVAATINRRFIACFQSTGRVGKSLTAEGFLMWLRYAQVKHLAIDADTQHRTLSRRYPDVGTFDAAKSLDDFSLMIGSLPDAPVIIVDYPAQATDFLIGASQHTQLLEFFESKGIRPTLLIFAADDPTAKESAAAVVRHFGDRADYLLVENPARFKSDSFKATKFHRWFQDRSTPTLRIPAITAPTIAAWERLEREEKQWLSFDAARKHPKMPDFNKMELDYIRNRFLAQFEDCASRILPDVGLIKKKVHRPKTMEPVVSNPLDDEFFA